MTTPEMAGEVVELAGLLVKSRAPSVAIGDFCEIRTRAGRTTDRLILN
jgi:hypothetical protein